ncbi:MAG: FAD-dependent oxidoreductase [Streptosporangiaceae bacterium]
MTSASADVLVIGAGVCGLSTAIVLLDAGMSVDVYAADPPHRTTSVAAGALWGLHMVGADERVGPWAALTMRRLRELAADPDAGISEIAGLAASSGESEPDHPAFTSGAGPATRCDPGELPAGFAAGWRYTAPVVDMPAYLDYLLAQMLGKGGRMQLGPALRDLSEAEDRWPAPAIVNCAGFGAHDLVPDAGLTAVRGQVVVAANPGLTEFFVGEREDPAEVTYIFPHGPLVVLGGTLQRGAVSLQPDPATADRIMKLCVAVEPRLAATPVLRHRVGLRPVRDGVRLDFQAVGSGRHLVHNYGHGGAGVTLSWGCAEAVHTEIARIFGR